MGKYTGKRGARSLVRSFRGVFAFCSHKITGAPARVCSLLAGTYRTNQRCCRYASGVVPTYLWK